MWQDIGEAHPISRAIGMIEQALDLTRDVDPAYLSERAHRDALLDLSRLADRAEALRMRLLRAADGPGGLAQSDGARSPATWLAARTRCGFGAARAAERLGEALDERWQRVGTALADGCVSLSQARVIVKALDALVIDPLPGEEVPAEVLELAEERLLELAGRHDPRQLETLGEKILQVVAPETCDDRERRLLERAEARASAATRLTFRRRGDGATNVHARIPDGVAARLRTMLGAWTAPAQDASRDGGAASSLGTFAHRDPATGIRLPQERLHGEAFRAFLEAADPERMPRQGGAATRLVVTVGLETLITGLGSATITSNGDDLTRISAGEARRLACQADLIPMVLGGKSQVLDQGRASRFFTDAQRLAKSQSQRTCCAEGCTIPWTWCDAHHGGDPWGRGGRSDLADLTFLCPWHHQRVHDPGFTTERLPDGGVRYRRRR
ncbi:HNH endonuclease signature motif containing protein [Nocardioides campestrisoli]|uniref:HNH endonuclease signature motif containing protein n=1 Tax=Nocardioides campestrisoli TaxID=2736757 RepID=UPI0015E6F509|nr:HNH endonuclease signature motif containing protein [Nocardioides campestrisoli]